MKYLIFAAVIAFIIENYGISQAKSIADCEPIERVALFRKYVLDLILGAVQPLLDADTIVDGGCECRLATDEHLNPVDLAFETMHIAKNLDRYLEAIKDTSNVSSLDPELMENIRRILVVLETWPDDINSGDVTKILKTYLSKYKRKKIRDEDVDLALKCYIAFYSLQCGNNRKFFDDLFNAFGIASELMRENAEKTKTDSRWNDLRVIIDRISVYQLITPKDEYTERASGLLFAWLYEKGDSDVTFNKLLECKIDSD